MENLNTDTITKEKSKADDARPGHQGSDSPLDFYKMFNGEVDLEKGVTPQEVLRAWLAFKELTLGEWNAFVSGAEKIDTSVVPPLIFKSWQRSREYGINPRGALNNEILAGRALEELFQNNRLLIDISQPFLDRLYKSMTTSSFTVSLSDKNGYILKVMQDEKYVDLHRQFNWRPGALWTEECCGTNTIGTLLKQKKPLQIIGAQHYKQIFHFLATSSAPIIDPEGEVIGGISIISLLFGAHPHTLGMAIAAVHAIENELRLRKALDRLQSAFSETDIAYSLQKAIIASIPEALIAVNTAGKITAVNARAQKLFGLENSAVAGEPLEAVFPEEANRRFWNLINRRDPLTDREVRLYSSRGSGDFTLTCSSIYSSGGTAAGRILLFSEIQRIKSLVNKFAGAKANLKFSDIHGRNEQLRRIIDEAHVISKSASNVLLLGESGTGKDILAQAIHNASPRRDGPYVAINCAAIPRDLMASELFGYAEGAFTGSRRGGSQGKFEMADGGTIFLDEIGDVSPAMQIKLLRVLQERVFEPLGSVESVKVDVRVIAATNRDLGDLVRRGAFREDLYYRINIVRLQLPALRERREDIPLLIEHLIGKFNRLQGKCVTEVSDDVLAILMAYDFPGNIRELENILEYAFVLCRGGRIEPEHLPPTLREKPPLTGKRLRDGLTLRDLETLHIRDALRRCRGNRAAAARELGINPSTLFRKLKSLRIPLTEGDGRSRKPR